MRSSTKVEVLEGSGQSGTMSQGGVPLCPVPLITSTLADERTFVREHYGDDFSCVGIHGLSEQRCDYVQVTGIVLIILRR